MKITRIVYEWPPPWMGLAPAPYELTRSQVKLGHEIDIFCGLWPKAGGPETLQNVKLHTVWRAPFQGTISFTSSLAMFLNYLQWRSRNQVDIIHAHGHFGLWIFLYRNILRKYFPWLKEMQTPLIVHFHNTVKGRRVKLEESEKEIKLISKILDWPLAELSDRLAVKTASACIFVSEKLRNEAIQYYKAQASRCYVVETGVNPEFFKPINPEEKAKTRIELRLNPQDKIILNVGALVERKNIHLIIESLTYLPKNYKLFLLGEGDESYTGKLDALIMEKKIKNRVIKVGYTPYPQIPIAYQSADLFVLPSSFEGQPKVVMESLACGTPVLGFGFRLEEEVTGLEYLENLEPMHIAEKISEMIKNPRQVDRYKIMKNYSWDVKAEQIEGIYKRVKENYLQ